MSLKFFMLLQWTFFLSSAHTLYDRPAEQFKRTSNEDKHKLLLKLSDKYKVFVPHKRYLVLIIT